MARPINIDQPPPVPDRPADAHKGTFGTVIVVGGCETMMGAPAICASSALRGGAGLVKIAAPAAVIPTALGIEPCATGVVLGSDVQDNLCSLAGADPDHRAVLAVGPGMGLSGNARELVIELLRGKRTVVLDADGLNHLAFTGQPRPTPGPGLVMTPHPGEFARLAKPLGISSNPTDPNTRQDAAAQLSLAHRAVVVLKGPRTVVTDGESFYVNATGNAAMAAAGSGDVLTGLIASLIAQGMKPLDAAILGVYLHGLAGDLWREDHGPSGLTARDLTDLLPRAFQLHRNAK